MLEVSDSALTEGLLKGPLLREGLLLKGPLLMDWDGERGSILISSSCLIDMMAMSYVDVSGDNGQREEMDTSSQILVFEYHEASFHRGRRQFSRARCQYEVLHPQPGCPQCTYL